MRLRWLLAALCFAAGAFCFSSFRWIENYEIRKDRFREGRFVSPITPEFSTIQLRRDAMGKGFFGASRNNNRTHQGIDILSKLGEPVLAAKTGRVVFAGEQKGYGNTVEITHISGRYSTIYAHLQAIFVKEGQWVVKDQKVGLVGKTGNAADPVILPHLHFEIKDQGKAIDPALCFDPKLQIKK